MFPFSEMMMTRTYRIHHMFCPKLSKGGPLDPNWNQISQNSEMIFFVPKLFCAFHKFAVCCPLNLSHSIHCVFLCWFLLSKAFSYLQLTVSLPISWACPDLVRFPDVQTHPIQVSRGTWLVLNHWLQIVDQLPLTHLPLTILTHFPPL